MPKSATEELIDLAEEGALSWEGIARECLQRMSEDDVKEMAEQMDWLPDCPGFYDDDDDADDDLIMPSTYAASMRD